MEINNELNNISDTDSENTTNILDNKNNEFHINDKTYQRNNSDVINLTDPMNGSLIIAKRILSSLIVDEIYQHLFKLEQKKQLIRKLENFDIDDNFDKCIYQNSLKRYKIISFNFYLQNSKFPHSQVCTVCDAHNIGLQKEFIYIYYDRQLGNISMIGGPSRIFNIHNAAHYLPKINDILTELNSPICPLILTLRDSQLYKFIEEFLLNYSKILIDKWILYILQVISYFKIANLIKANKQTLESLKYNFYLSNNHLDCLTNPAIILSYNNISAEIKVDLFTGRFLLIIPFLDQNITNILNEELNAIKFDSKEFFWIIKQILIVKFLAIVCY